ncbi:MAG: glycerol-3-phosphate dehydrogenase C-terminal domain-containing protein, partial [Myxococcota bacterium]
ARTHQQNILSSVRLPPRNVSSQHSEVWNNVMRSDVLIRRTQLFYRDSDQGLGAVDKVAEQMAAILNWTAEQTEQNVLAYRAEVERSRCWRTG